MASAGRCSELQALVFDPQYIQFKPKGAGVTLYFTPEFIWKNQRPNQVNDPWYIPAAPTGKPDFGAPNCPIRSRLVPSSVGRALGSHYAKYTTHTTLFYQDKVAIIEVHRDSNVHLSWQGWFKMFAVQFG